MKQACNHSEVESSGDKDPQNESRYYYRDAIQSVFRFLGLADLARAAVTCRSWYEDACALEPQTRHRFVVTLCTESQAEYMHPHSMLRKHISVVRFCPWFSGEALFPHSVAMVCALLQGAGGLRELVACARYVESDRSFSVSEMAQMFTAIAARGTLESLHVQSVSPSALCGNKQGIGSLCFAVSRCTNLHTLVLQEVYIEDEMALALGLAIASASQLVTLTLSHGSRATAKLIKVGSVHIFNGLAQNASICNFTFEDSEFSLESAMALANAVAQPSSALSVLRVPEAMMSGPMLAAISGGIARSRRLQVFDCSINYWSYHPDAIIGEVGASALFEAVGQCPTLTEIDVAGHVIEAASLVPLANSLALPTSDIRVLSLCRCGIGNNHLDGLGRVLATSRALEELQLSNNHFSGLLTNIGSFTRGLAANQSLQRLDIQGCSLSGANMFVIAHMVKAHKSMRQLHIGNRNYIYDEEDFCPRSVLESMVDAVLHGAEMRSVCLCPQSLYKGLFTPSMSDSLAAAAAATGRTLSLE